MQPVQPKCGLADIVFVIDSSGSIDDTDPGNWRLVLDFIVDFVDNLDIGEDGARVGMVVYSETASSSFYLNSYFNKDVLRREIYAQPHLDSFTNTSGGLRVMKDEQFTFQRGDRPGIRNMAIVVTDGQSNRDADRTIQDAEEARRQGIEIFSIGISTAVNENELRGISSQPQEMNRNWFQSQDFRMLESVVSDLIRSACETPTLPSGGGGAGENCGSKKIDLVFLIDSSGSINADDPQNFDRILRFLVDILEPLAVGSDIRVGLISYSQTAENQFYLDSYSDKRSITDNILRTRYLNSFTNTSGALRTMVRDQFVRSRGDRLDADNICILITDGVANIDQTRTRLDAEDAHARGIQIFAVGITNNINPDELRDISSRPRQENTNWWRTMDFNTLANLRQDLQTALGGNCPTQGDYFCRLTSEAGIMCFCNIDRCTILPMNDTACVNINECRQENGGCDQNCFDSVGTYSCSCDRGFDLGRDLRSCSDINECDFQPCPRDAVCVNGYGSYYCLIAPLVDGARLVDGRSSNNEGGERSGEGGGEVYRKRGGFSEGRPSYSEGSEGRSEGRSEGAMDVKSKRDLDCEGSSCVDNTGTTYSCETDNRCIAVGLVGEEEPVDLEVSDGLSKKTLALVTISVAFACLLLTIVGILLVRQSHLFNFTLADQTDQTEQIEPSSHYEHYATAFNDSCSSTSSAAINS